MKLYPIPGGGWAGTEAEWKAAMKAKGLNPKDFETTKTREVPTGKKELMEFLTFFAVDVYRTGTAAPAPTVDLAALQAKFNPVEGDSDPHVIGSTDTEATVQLSRMDNPGVDIEGIIEIICNSKGAMLKRFAGAVAGAFSALAT